MATEAKAMDDGSALEVVADTLCGLAGKLRVKYGMDQQAAFNAVADGAIAFAVGWYGESGAHAIYEDYSSDDRAVIDGIRILLRGRFAGL
jgi:hypothetical protein